MSELQNGMCSPQYIELEFKLEMRVFADYYFREAPEVLSRKKPGHKSQHYTPAADVYSFSMSLYVPSWVVVFCEKKT